VPSEGPPTKARKKTSRVSDLYTEPGNKSHVHSSTASKSVSNAVVPGKTPNKTHVHSSTASKSVSNAGAPGKTGKKTVAFQGVSATEEASTDPALWSVSSFCSSSAAEAAAPAAKAATSAKKAAGASTTAKKTAAPAAVSSNDAFQDVSVTKETDHAERTASSFCSVSAANAAAPAAKAASSAKKAAAPAVVSSYDSLSEDETPAGKVVDYSETESD
jgi:hypothetical protein